jgi:hypothetical protein
MTMRTFVLRSADKVLLVEVDDIDDAPVGSEPAPGISVDVDRRHERTCLGQPYPQRSPCTA